MQPSERRHFKYVGFWYRFFALIIDSVIINYSFILLRYLTGGEPSLLEIVFLWLYFTILESSSWQGTVGKKLLGLKVVDLNGQRISFLRANARYFSKYISFILLGIGFLMVAFTSKKQGLHDKIAGTLVIKEV